MRAAPTSQAERDSVLDPTEPWPASDIPWLDVADLELHRVVDSGKSEALQFNIGNTPPELGIVPAHSAEDPASVNHARVLAYAASARARQMARSPGTLRDAIIDAARSLRSDQLVESAPAEPPEQIAAALRNSALRDHPNILDDVLVRLADHRTEEPGEVPRQFFEHVAQLAARFGNDPSALDEWIQIYRPVSLELLRWRTHVTCELHTSYAELRDNLLKTPGILAGMCTPAAVTRHDDDTLSAVLRFASRDAAPGRAILTEYACSLKRDGPSWRVQAALETEYREELSDAATLGRYIQRPLQGREREVKLHVARAGGLLVDAFERAGHVEVTSRSRRVCVVGGGPAGLSVARELEHLGHQVTVFERAAVVSGKCASMQIDDHAFDLGGHLFGDHHHAVKQLAADLACRLESATSSLEYDLEAAAVLEASPVAFTATQVERYQRARATTFSQIGDAGLASVAKQLAQPAASWLAEQDLDAIAATGVAFTASGYGFLSDPELAALYPARFAEMLGLLSSQGGQRWCIAGGMQGLWQRVAGELRDVRVNSTITGVERDQSGVCVTADGQRFDFDDLVLALPLERALDFLDATESERSVFSRIRYVSYHTTVCTVSGLPRNGFYLNSTARRRHLQSWSPGRIPSSVCGLRCLRVLLLRRQRRVRGRPTRARGGHRANGRATAQRACRNRVGLLPSLQPRGSAGQCLRAARGTAGPASHLVRR